MKKTLCFAIPALVLLAVITVVVAYNNVGTHPTINGTVVDKFEARVNASTPASKFANYIFVFDGNAEFTGPAVTKPGNWDIEVKNESKTPKEWVKHGGYAADEPEVFAALRHFYDPQGINDGKRYLTNRGTYWEGLAANPGIDAKSWAISDPRKRLELAKRPRLHEKSPGRTGHEAPGRPHGQSIPLPGGNHAPAGGHGVPGACAK